MLNLNSIIIGSSQPKALSQFYEKVFGKPPDMDGDEWSGWLVGTAFFSIGPHSEIVGGAKEPQRIILNFETEEVQEEYDRLVAMGVMSIKEPYEMQNMWIATLADPDGNYFQLTTPWKEA